LERRTARENVDRPREVVRWVAAALGVDHLFRRRYRRMRVWTLLAVRPAPAEVWVDRRHE
jgi:hypothetical protein